MRDDFVELRPSRETVGVESIGERGGGGELWEGKGLGGEHVERGGHVVRGAYA